MNSESNLIHVPQNDPNESKAILVEWHVSDGKRVSAGDIICSLETAKAIFDVESNFSGYIVHLVEIDQEVEVSAPLALIAKSAITANEEREKYLSTNKVSVNVKKSTTLTKIAINKAKELEVDINSIDKSGIITEKDVEHFAI